MMNVPAVDRDAAFTVDNRIRIELDLGRLGRATVVGIPAPLLTADEWRTIVSARQSYRMWGSGQELDSIDEDAFDGRGQFATWYATTHYFGTISTPGKQDKVITMRKVGARLDGPSRPLIEDISFWNVRDLRTGVTIALADALSEELQRVSAAGAPIGGCNVPVAGLSRGATLVDASGPRDTDDQNRSAVVYALIQVAAAQHDEDYILHAGQICTEFRTKAFALEMPERGRIEWTTRTRSRPSGLRQTGTE